MKNAVFYLEKRFLCKMSARRKCISKNVQNRQVQWTKEREKSNLNALRMSKINLPFFLKKKFSTDFLRKNKQKMRFLMGNGRK